MDALESAMAADAAAVATGEPAEALAAAVAAERAIEALAAVVAIEPSADALDGLAADIERLRANAAGWRMRANR